MDHDDDGETSYNTFVDDVAFEPTDSSWAQRRNSSVAKMGCTMYISPI